MTSIATRHGATVALISIVLTATACASGTSTSARPTAGPTANAPTPSGDFGGANARGAFAVPTVSQSPVPGTGAFNPAGGPPVGQDAQVAGVAADQLTVQLTPVGGSNVTGTATLSEPANGQTHVILLVRGVNGVQPAEIHEGRCPSPDLQGQWTLTDVNGGTSVTDVSATLQNITHGLSAIVVHQSHDDPTVIACGDIQRGPATGAGS